MRTSQTTGSAHPACCGLCRWYRDNPCTSTQRQACHTVLAKCRWSTLRGLHALVSQRLDLARRLRDCDSIRRHALLRRVVQALNTERPESREPHACESRAPHVSITVAGAHRQLCPPHVALCVTHLRCACSRPWSQCHSTRRRTGVSTQRGRAAHDSRSCHSLATHHKRPPDAPTRTPRVPRAKRKRDDARSGRSWHRCTP